MTSKNRQPLAVTFPCDGTDRVGHPTCSNFVKSRKPSASGRHYCPEPECQAAKQRWMRADRKAKARSSQPGAVDEVSELVRTLGTGRRVTCDTCGYANALPGWAHRIGVGVPEPCFGTGGQGGGLPKGMLDLAMPDLVAT